jgi:hypothetical protein
MNFKIRNLACIGMFAVAGFFSMPVTNANALLLGGCTNPALTVARCSLAALKAYCKSVRLNTQICCIANGSGGANVVIKYKCRSANGTSADAEDADVVIDADTIDAILAK